MCEKKIRQVIQCQGYLDAIDTHMTLGEKGTGVVQQDIQTGKAPLKLPCQLAHLGLR
jgi:hypothetical protein